MKYAKIAGSAAEAEKLRRRLRGVIFDLDGVLLNSTGLWAQIDRQILAHYGRAVPPDISEIVKKMSISESSRYFVERFSLPVTPAALSEQIAAFAENAYLGTLPLKPHVVDLLDFLDEKKIPYGVATATYPRLAKGALSRLGLWERVRFLWTEEEAGASKTSPPIFLAGAQKLGMKPEQIAVAEDSLHALETAGAAGFFTVGIFDDASQGDWEKIRDVADMTIFQIDEMRVLFL